jgi:WD40 repeat protein/tRNA A-37 threonylcarbamoyl transferase component Bud32
LGVSLPSIPGYEVDAILGQGGMGVVYHARHIKLNRIVAIKMSIAGVYAGPIDRESFQREAEAVAALQHPNVVQIHDVGDSDGRPYFTMEYLAGGSLAQTLKGIPLPATDVATLLATLARAVDAAHCAGIVHRDLKPANVLLTADGRPKVTDFGLARRLVGDNGVTRIGTAVGTPSYMAPEQASGKSDSAGPPVDVYALGAILYELLTGRPPFRAETAADTILQVLSQDPVPPTKLNGTVPRDLEAICMKCLEKNPRKRYSAAGEIAADLERFSRGENVLARPPGKLERVRRWALRHKSIAAALSGGIFFLIVLTAGSLFAAAHFRRLEGEQRVLARDNGELANEKESARAKAEQAEQQEAELRKLAERQGEDLRRNLYIAQMNLAGQAAVSPSGIGRIRERLIPWDQDQPDLRAWEWYYFLSLCHRDLITLRGNALGVQSVAWSPDGRCLASAGADGVICLWNTSGQVIAFLRGHSHVAAAVAWSPDSKRIASASWDETVKVWDVASGKELFTVREHAGPVFTVAWSADGTRLASGGTDRTVRIWDSTDGGAMQVLQGHDQPVAAVAWHPEGKRIASAGRDATVRIWNAKTGKEERKIGGHTNWVNSVAWSADGRRLASASNDQTAKIWDPDDGRDLLTLRGHVEGVQSVAWSPDGDRLATTSYDHTVKIWAADGNTSSITLRGHTASVAAVAWYRDGTRLASAGLDGTIKFWDAASSCPETVPLNGHAGPIYAAAWSRGPHPLLASASSDGTIKVWNVSLHKAIATLRGHDGEVRSVSWNPSGTRLSSAGLDGTVRVWDAVTSKEVTVLRGHAGEVFAVSWSPDGRQLASAGADGVVRLWDAEGGAELHSYRAHGHWVYSLAWSPDGTCLASASGDQSVIVWDVGTGQEKFRIRAHTGEVTSVAWSADGRWLASASFDQTVKIIDARNGKVCQTLRGHTSRVNSVDWNPVGNRLVSASNDRTVKVWDVVTGREALTLVEHLAQVNVVAWNPDGLTLVSAGIEPTLLVRDATAGYVVARSPNCLPVLDRRIASNPKDPDVWRLRAQVYAALGDWDRAAADLRKHIALIPDQRWIVMGNWVAGPYPDDMQTRYEPEWHPDPSQPTARDAIPRNRRIWTTVPSDVNVFTDFGSLYDRAEYISAYTLIRVYSLERQPIALLLGSDDGIRLWLNGKQIYENLLTRRAEPDEDAVMTILEPGWNTLIARVANGTKEHALFLRLSGTTEDLRRARIEQLGNSK